MLSGFAVGGRAKLQTAPEAIPAWFCLRAPI